MTSRNPIGSLPAVFGRYLLLRRLSRGGMGEIFLGKVGEIEGFEKPIVIKKILPDLAADQEFLQLFIEEAQIAIKLAHSNIVPVYEVGMAQDQYFLAMQYIEGRDLRALLTRANERRRRVTPDLALFIGREIANGLAYAHRRTDERGDPLDLVHCDISPPNVLVSWEGEVKIIDFGIAKSAMQHAAENEDVGFGKFGYMAPEQLIRGAAVDRRADIYSTGVLLYELLTGQRLFNFPAGVDYRRVARDVTAGRYKLPSEANPSLGEGFNALVLRALATDPSQRYQSAEELRDAVQQQLYSMNPTISADTLAALMREIYAEDITADRKMLSELSGTDLQPFQHQLHDGTSHTVSIALGAGLIGATSSVPVSTLASSSLQPSFGRITPRAAARDDAPTGTRQLGAEERRRAASPMQSPELAGAAARDPGSLTAMVGRDLSRRRTVLIATGAALAAASIVLSVVFWPSSNGAGSASGSGEAIASASSGEAGVRESAGNGDAGVHMRFAPDPVEQSDARAGAVASTGAVPAPGTVAGTGSAGVAPGSGSTAVAGVNGGGGSGAGSGSAGDDGSTSRVKLRRHAARNRAAARRRRARRRRLARLRRARRLRALRRKRAAAAAAKARKRNKPSTSFSRVRRKYRRVKREYLRFARSYGERLRQEWQRILFANTYAGDDAAKYRRLDQLLDQLRRKMARIRSGG